MTKYIKHIVVIMVAVILGGSYMVGQISKQNSIERQQQVKIEAEQELIKLEAIKERVEREAEEEQKGFERMLYLSCKQKAEREYWDYVELNMTSKDAEGTIRAEFWVWDRANEDKRQKIEDCKDLYLK